MLNKWDPFSPDELNQTLSGYDCTWWLAGGYAIDLYLQMETRAHDDIDIVIPRNEQIHLQKFLKDWELYVADGDLTMWNHDDFLRPPVYDIWAMKDGWFRFQIMLLDVIGDRWVFKRNPVISDDLTAFGMKIREMPIIKPEIQLLYKFYQKEPRTKDHNDWNNCYPQLNDQAKEWLDHNLVL